ncbi:MAG: prepilin-type N-terminal cleavage/methylation domain-containing protein [Planctomycetota bacterium]|nr:prepilin-type N-terminal cleavage/methylation domain-containing protein [Planctomycetota bacterium]
METSMRIRPRQRGVTLIELMIALSLLAVILASLLAVFDAILSLSQSGSNLTVATLDAQQVMEEAGRFEYDDLLTFTPTQRTNLEAQTISISISGEDGAIVTNPLPDLVRIAVLIRWKERGTDVSTALTTLRARGF